MIWLEDTVYIVGTAL